MGSGSIPTMEALLPLGQRLYSAVPLYKLLRSERHHETTSQMRTQSIAQTVEEVQKEIEGVGELINQTIDCNTGLSTQLMNHLFLIADPGKAKLCTSSSFKGNRYLSPYIAALLWVDGIFQRNNRYGKGESACLDIGGHRVWFKRLPGLAGFEHAVTLRELLENKDRKHRLSMPA